MTKRTKRGPNNSESTGRIGQELPIDQPKPLRPAYPEAYQEQGPVEIHHEDQPVASEGLAPEEPLLEVASVEELPGEAVPDLSGTLADAVTTNVEPELPTPTGPVTAASDAAAFPEGKVVVETQPESLGVPPPELSGVKSPRGYVVLTIGLPGSGKTTWFKRRGVTPLSSDMLRSILFDDITEQRYQGLVFSTLRSLLRARLIAKMPWNYVDATNLSPHERRQWIKMAKSFGYDVQAVFFDVPFEVCMERNSRRERNVNEESMRKMADRLRPPSFKEGFSKITVVRVKSPSAAEGEASGGIV
ncbi:ATP-binding protein [Acidisarcina polymorpha]|nr:ATP-binding protein [Acidisarcina polymorpha]